MSLQPTGAHRLTAAGAARLRSVDRRHEVAATVVPIIFKHPWVSQHVRVGGRSAKVDDETGTAETTVPKTSQNVLPLAWLTGCVVVLLLSVVVSAAHNFADHAEAALNQLRDQGCFSDSPSEECETLVQDFQVASRADEAVTRPWMVAYLTALGGVSFVGLFAFGRAPYTLTEPHASQKGHPLTRTSVRSLFLVAGAVAGLLATVPILMYWEHAPVLEAIAHAGLSIFILFFMALIGLGIGVAFRHLRGWLSSPTNDTAQSNPKAIASLVCGIVGISIIPFVLPIAAIILGNGARRELLARPQDSGSGSAVAGVLLGWIGIAFNIMVATIVLILLL
jgi:hypothetical protein